MVRSISPSELNTASFLMVDDSRADMGLMKEAFKVASLDMIVSLTCVYSGEEAISKIKERYEDGYSYDLVTIDLNMPQTNGKQVLKFIKDDLKFEGICAIIMSNSNNAYDIAECMKLGADAYIQKPYNFSRLVDFFLAVKESLHNTSQVIADEILRNYDEREKTNFHKTGG